ncbi:MAG TPA: hypothetical protein VNO70_07940 [Blastocatellia bacterium]|nr:hypothetical protein [Blastocatellia bacterium]
MGNDSTNKMYSFVGAASVCALITAMARQVAGESDLIAGLASQPCACDVQRRHEKVGLCRPCAARLCVRLFRKRDDDG